MDQNCFWSRIWKAKEVVRCYGKKNVYVPFFNRCKYVNTKAKDNHLRQLNSFKILGNRYRVISEHD